MTLVPLSSYNAGSTGTIAPSDFCQHIPLSLAALDGIYGSPADTNWGALSCSGSYHGTTTTTTAGSTTTTTTGVSSTGLDPIAIAQLRQRRSHHGELGPDHAARQHPGIHRPPIRRTDRAGQPPPDRRHLYGADRDLALSDVRLFQGGDQATLGKIIGLDPRTVLRARRRALQQLGAIMPVASVWTGDPLGVPWNLPTAAVQNAQGAYVAPSTAAAAAAEADATLASTSDPTTNNLVTFMPSTTDAAAYNNDLMLESYLVVPTNGLSSDKALALGQLIRFVLGSEGQKDISALGAAPATTAMVTAGLQVAQQLDVEAATTADVTSSTDCSTTTTTTADQVDVRHRPRPSSSTTTTSTSSPTTRQRRRRRDRPPRRRLPAPRRPRRQDRRRRRARQRRRRRPSSACRPPPRPRRRPSSTTTSTSPSTSSTTSTTTPSTSSTTSTTTSSRRHDDDDTSDVDDHHVDSTTDVDDRTSTDHAPTSDVDDHVDRPGLDDHVYGRRFDHHVNESGLDDHVDVAFHDDHDRVVNDHDHCPVDHDHHDLPDHHDDRRDYGGQLGGWRWWHRNAELTLR